MIDYTDYPNPQFCRNGFQSLNGKWDFAIIENLSPNVLTENFDKIINVPYCPESILSGIGYTKEFNYCKYRRIFSVKKEEDKRIVIHFGAVDYFAMVYVNEIFVGSHIGGYTPFSFDITNVAIDGDNSIVLLVYDNVNMDSPSGKQSDKAESYGCYYTRTTGIWQSVWIEYLPKQYIKSVKFYPDIKESRVKIKTVVCGKGELSVKVSFGGKLVGEFTQEGENLINSTLKLSSLELWEVGKGNLYDVEISFNEDKIYTYFGMREVEIIGNKFLLNGKSIFQNLVLDQGYYREGIYTAPDKATMQHRIKMATDLGFNGARLHQKIFEPLFLYYCDKAGYLTWGEFASWGLEHFEKTNVGFALNQWIEEIDRDFNHPAIITWCPLNEAWNDGYKNKGFVKEADIDYITLFYSVAKECDGTRPCVDSSGGFHSAKTDLYDFHDYCGYDGFVKAFDAFEKDGQLTTEPNLVPKGEELNYKGQPLFVSEYGGQSISQEGWGYNGGNITAKQWIDDVCKMTEYFKSKKYIAGLCYTQLYDVEQEQNGFYTYDNQPKFTKEQAKELYKAFAKKSVIED